MISSDTAVVSPSPQRESRFQLVAHLCAKPGHHTFPLTLFNNDSAELMCDACAADQPSANAVPISVAANSRRLYLQEELRKASARIAVLQDVVPEFDASEKELLWVQQQQIQHLQTSFDALRAELDAAFARSKSMVESLTAAELSTLRSRKDSVIELASLMQDRVSDIDRWIDPPTAAASASSPAPSLTRDVRLLSATPAIRSAVGPLAEATTASFKVKPPTSFGGPRVAVEGTLEVDPVDALKRGGEGGQDSSTGVAYGAVALPVFVKVDRARWPLPFIEGRHTVEEWVGLLEREGGGEGEVLRTATPSSQPRAPDPPLPTPRPAERGDGGASVERMSTAEAAAALRARLSAGETNAVGGVGSKGGRGDAQAVLEESGGGMGGAAVAVGDGGGGDESFTMVGDVRGCDASHTRVPAAEAVVRAGSPTGTHVWRCLSSSPGRAVPHFVGHEGRVAAHVPLLVRLDEELSAHYVAPSIRDFSAGGARDGGGRAVVGHSSAWGALSCKGLSLSGALSLTALSPSAAHTALTVHVPISAGGGTLVAGDCSRSGSLSPSGDAAVSSLASRLKLAFAVHPNISVKDWQSKRTLVCRGGDGGVVPYPIDCPVQLLRWQARRGGSASTITPWASWGVPVAVCVGVVVPATPPQHSSAAAAAAHSPSPAPFRLTGGGAVYESAPKPPSTECVVRYRVSDDIVMRSVRVVIQFDDVAWPPTVTLSPPAASFHHSERRRTLTLVLPNGGLDNGKPVTPVAREGELRFAVARRFPASDAIASGTEVSGEAEEGVVDGADQLGVQVVGIDFEGIGTVTGVLPLSAVSYSDVSGDESVGGRT